MAAILLYADGAHRENLIAALPRIRKWAEKWRVSVFPIIGGCDGVPNGGADCFKKVWMLKEVMGYAGEPTPFQMSYGTIDPDELCIYVDCDIVLRDLNVDPKEFEKYLDKADIACLFHPSVADAKRTGKRRIWMNGGVMAFRNTQKMRDYWNNIWVEKAPYCTDEGYPEEVAAIVREWYKRRWTKGTDEMRISKDVFEGKLTANELPIRFNVCWECPKDSNGMSDEDSAFIIHWAWINDKSVVLRRQKSLTRKLEGA